MLGRPQRLCTLIRSSIIWYIPLAQWISLVSNSIPIAFPEGTRLCAMRQNLQFCRRASRAGLDLFTNDNVQIASFTFTSALAEIAGGQRDGSPASLFQDGTRLLGHLLLDQLF